MVQYIENMIKFKSNIPKLYFKFCYGNKAKKLIICFSGTEWVTFNLPLVKNFCCLSSI